MTHLTGMTLTQFNSLVEDMRKVYPFTDDQTRITNTRDMASGCNCVLELFTHDEENDVCVWLSKGIDYRFLEKAEEEK